MSRPTILPVTTDEAIQNVSILADEIWHQHYVTIIGEAQVDYMVEKFQSLPAISKQIRQDGYEYFLLSMDDLLAGYAGVLVEEDSLFLSKLYIKESFRGMGLARQTVDFLKNICKERNLDRIYLTCNINNHNTLNVYDRLGFKIIESVVGDIGHGFVMDDYILELKI